jgi:hypothetical protein
MARYGYSYVTDKGFSAFGHELELGPWKNVLIKEYDAEDRKPSKSLIEAPREVTWKLRLTWALRDLDDALGISADKLKQYDDEWDASQRALSHYLASEAEHKDPARRAAAGRLRGTLLEGAGTEQTTWGFEAEVDFGYQQIARARKEPLVQDAQLIGLDSYLTRVEEATNALGKALGRDPGGKRTMSPAKRLRDAVATCSTAFNAVHEDLDWIVEHTPAGQQLDTLQAMHAPFLALLERYPKRTKQEGEEAPAEGTAEAPKDPKQA